MPEVVVAADPKSVADLAASFIGRLIDSKEGDKFHIALSGGSTPRLLFETMANEPYLSQIDWQKLQIWWSDERMVAKSSDDSNYKMAQDELLSKVPIPEENIHPVNVEITTVEAADQYQQELESFLNGDTFDLVLLGVGLDGHTASIFPGSLTKLSDSRLATWAEGGDSDVERITFTYRLINSACDVIVFVTGKEKATIVERVLMGDPKLPASLVKPDAGESHLHFFLDRAAAEDLDQG